MVTSDLARSKETARLALLLHTNLKWEEDGRIKERDYGDLTGQSKRAWMEKDPERTSLWRRGYDVAPPNGESLKMVEEPVPVHVVMNPNVGLLGAAAVAAGLS